MYRMAKTKVSTLNLRIEPGLKEAVKEAAAREHRSVANMVEMLIRRHCEQRDITIPEQNDFFPISPTWQMEVTSVKVPSALFLNNRFSLNCANCGPFLSLK